jgi:glycerol-3-phosphate dehydrogenase (NAD(P)+)
MTGSKPSNNLAPIAVLGAGSWGTALALHLARQGLPVRLWARDAAALATMAEAGENARYLPGEAFPDALQPATDLTAAVCDAGLVLLAVPSHGLRETLSAIAPALADDTPIAWATKGFEQDTGALPHQVVAAILGEDRRGAVLSGPSFAREVAAGLPTAITAASTDASYARELAALFSTSRFRTYASDDVIGVEVGGAVKNVLAIAAGISDGLGYGANARTAVITRGLAELVRLAEALGARRETLMGLSGMGDLILTCTDDQSRNRRMGLALARGLDLESAAREIGQVVEGVLAARAVNAVAEHLGVEMPICTQVFQVIHHGRPPREAVDTLMGRTLKDEG